MSVLKFTADTIFPVSGPPLENTALICDATGKILALEPMHLHDPASVRRFKGTLIPGFVNTHCHLELSHMKGMVDTGTGLIPFITAVVTKRNAAPEVIAAAIREAERAMYRNGIVAVGDISNTPDTFFVKRRGRLRYYTFVELFDFLQESGADKTFADWSPVFKKCPLRKGSQKAYVPHAPYSVSKKLFSKINKANHKTGISISIHNQETPSENALFMDKTGGFPGFYEKFGIGLDEFQPSGLPSIHYAIQHLDPANRTLFVHNTLTTRADIEIAQKWSPNTFWASCPNANLYIENRLPNYRFFIDTGACVTLGTDSLTSNWQLSILEEMKTIARYQSYVGFDTLLAWATLNGARALGFDGDFGSFEEGKTPGVLWLRGLEGNVLTGKETVKRLV